jgi:predicted TIM-barrel fold metal-dependent hydrolase
MADTREHISAEALGTVSAEALAKLPSFMISADSHAQEPADLYDRLPPKYRDRIPQRAAHLKNMKRPEGAASANPRLRVVDMETDGVAGEVLYPDRGLGFFSLEPDLQEAVFAHYNDWLADFCKDYPKRLFGIAAIPVYDIKKAVKELHRTHDMGLHGCLIWEVPDPKLPFTSPHYEPLWAAAAELGAPINIHILTGFGYHMNRKKGIDHVRGTVNHKANDTINSVFDVLWSGVFDRHPKLKFAIIESEIGWLPFILQQWDYNFLRFSRPGPTQDEFPINRLPSEIFHEHCFATFMDDPVGSKLLPSWGENNCMWSSDYPHINMTWPKSRAFAARQLAGLPEWKQKRLLSQNVIDLYGLTV